VALTNFATHRQTKDNFKQQLNKGQANLAGLLVGGFRVGGPEARPKMGTL